MDEEDTEKGEGEEGEEGRSSMRRRVKETNNNTRKRTDTHK